MHLDYIAITINNVWEMEQNVILGWMGWEQAVLARKISSAHIIND